MTIRASRAFARRALSEPTAVGRLTLPPLGLVVLAAIGGALLLVVALDRWATPSDEHAYWLAARRLLDGLPLYDPTATSITPYAYWYPPVFAQVMAPVALVLPSLWFTAAWTLLMLACLWWLADRNVLVALALVAFPPVAVEFWFRNIHLVLAVLLVLSVRRGWLFPVGAAIKLAPGIGIAWLAARGRWRDAGVAVGVGIAILAVSIAISPGRMGGLGRDRHGPGTGRRGVVPAGAVPRPGGGRVGARAGRRQGAPALGGGAARRGGHHRASDTVDDRAQPACGGRADVATPSVCGARSTRLTARSRRDATLRP